MTAAKDKMKQRSFYMDDETYALIERHAERLGASNGTALRMIVRAELLDEAPAPVSQRPVDPERLTEVGRKIGEIKAGVVLGSDGAAQVPGHDIVLPPDNQETFKVPEKFREKGLRGPRPTHSDDDF